MAQDGRQRGEDFRVLAAESVARSGPPPRPCRRRKAASPPPPISCRCAAHWWRRYCPSRSCAHRRRRTRRRRAARTGSSPADSPAPRLRARTERGRGRDHGARTIDRLSECQSKSIAALSKTHSPPTKVIRARPWNLRPSKAVLRARECSIALIQHKGFVRVQQHQIGGRALGQRAGVQAQDARRAWRSALSAHGSGWHGRRDRGSSAAGSSVSSPTAPKAAAAKGLALGVGALRLMAGNDHVDHAAGHAFHHGGAVGFGAQRRLHFAEGVIGADIQLVEQQMMGGDAAGDGKSARLGGGDGVQRRRGWKSGRSDSARRSARPGGCRARR